MCSTRIGSTTNAVATFTAAKSVPPRYGALLDLGHVQRVDGPRIAGVARDAPSPAELGQKAGPPEARRRVASRARAFRSSRARAAAASSPMTSVGGSMSCRKLVDSRPAVARHGRARPIQRRGESAAARLEHGSDGQVDCRPRRGPATSSVLMPHNGTPRPAAMPLATLSATRTPVNEPGPRATTRPVRSVAVAADARERRVDLHQQTRRVLAAGQPGRLRQDALAIEQRHAGGAGRRVQRQQQRLASRRSGGRR